MTRIMMSLATVALALSASACGESIRALVPGEDACRFCRMTIDDVRFGGLVQTARGRIETFDSIECLASFVSTLPATERPRGVWVTNFERPGEWVPAERARYLQNSAVKSPMGRELAAFASSETPEALVSRHGGRALTWSDVTTLVARSLAAPVAARDTGLMLHTSEQ